MALALLLLPAAAAARTTMELVRYRLEGGSAWTSVRPVTRANVQAALDKASPTRRLEVRLGSGNLDADSTIWVHGNTSIRGSGHGVTVLSRSRFNEHDPIGAGNILVSAAYGKHAMNSSIVHGLPADSLQSIEIVGLTVDGNCARWPKVNPNGPQNFGINLFYVDHPLLEDVEVRNTLQTGIQYYGCRNGVMRHIWTQETGKEIVQGSRNGINLNDNAASLLPKLWGEGFTLSNIHIRNQKDTAFGFCNVSHVMVNGVHISCDHDTTYGNYGFEFEGYITGYAMHGFRITNVRATGLANQFLRNNIQKCDLEDVSLDSCTCAFSTRAHRGGALRLKDSRPNRLTGFEMANCEFTNINGSMGDFRTASAAMVYCFNNGGKDCHGLRIRRCRFQSTSPDSQNSANPGVRFGGRFSDAVFDSVTLIGVEAEGFQISAGPGDSLREVTISHCLVDGARASGFSIAANSHGVVDGVTLHDCTAKDTNRSGPGSSFEVIGRAGGAVRNVRLEGCRVVRTDGTNMGGFRATQESGAEVDSVTVRDCDFSRAAGQPYSTSGKVTNLTMPGTGR